MNAHNEQQARKLLALGLDEFGHHTEAYNVRNGIDRDVYKAELWAIRAALDAQPAAAPVSVTRDADGEIVMVKQGDTIIASTCHAGGKANAAPEIDYRSLIEKWRNSGNPDYGDCADDLEALIDASPKGEAAEPLHAHYCNAQPSSAECICGLDSPKGGSEARDAARYRWLREFAVNGSIGIPFHGWLNCDEPASEWDSAIDVAMQAGDAEVRP
jgi:hypothetical protein